MVRFWCSLYPTQHFWVRPVILDRFQGPGRSFSDQKLGLKSKSGFSGHPRYLRPKLRTSDQNALKQTGSEGPQNLSMGFWHVKHQFYLPAQKCSNLTHPSVHIVGQPKFLEDFGVKLHHWVWPKTWLHTNFWVPTTSLYHNTRASKQAILSQY